MVTERTVATNGIDLHLAEAGPDGGPPVVLLHGFPDSWKLWRHQLDALAAAGMRVLAPDLRGLGQTTRPAEVEAYRMRTLVGDVTGLLDTSARRGRGGRPRLGRRGGLAGAMFAPDRVERLVAVSVGHPLAGVAAGLPQRRCPGTCCGSVPRRRRAGLPADDWEPCTAMDLGRRRSPVRTPDLDRQLADLSRPGALEAGLNWYRANNDPTLFPTPTPPGSPCPPVDLPDHGRLVEPRPPPSPKPR
jgi:pimeloyl-ACP methyl ester carboxylesterase